MPELNDKEIEELVNEVWEQEEFRAFRNDREEWDAIIHQQQAIPLPDLYKNANVPLSRSYEAEYARQVTMQELGRAVPVYVIQSRAFPHERAEAAQNFEHFMNHQRMAWLDRPDDPYTLIAGDQTTKGVGVGKLDLRSFEVIGAEGKKFDIWPDRPVRPGRNGQTPKEWRGALTKYRDELVAYKLRTPTPFTFEYVPVTTCAWFEAASGEEPEHFVERSAKALNVVLKTYGLGFSASGQLRHLAEGEELEKQYSRKDRVTFYELCTPDYIYHLIKQPDAKDLFRAATYPNPFGAVRHIIFPGRVMNEPGITRRYQPLIHGSIEAAKERSYFATMRKFAAAQTALIIYDVVTEEEGVPYLDPKTGKPMIITIRPFEPVDYQLPPGTKLVRREGQAGADLDKIEAAQLQELQRYGPQEVLTGGTAGEREAAWSLAIRGERAEHGIRPGLRGQNKGWRQIARMIAYCVKNWIKEDVYIWGVVKDEMDRTVRKQIRVKPDDIEEDFDIDVDMGYKSTAITLADRESLRRAKVEGDVSRLRLQQDGYNVTDPIAEDFQIDIEQVDQVSRKFTLADAVEAVITTEREKLGLPPLPPEEVAMARAMVLGVNPPEAEARRPANAVHTTAEAPPTPIRQRAL